MSIKYKLRETDRTLLHKTIQVTLTDGVACKQTSLQFTLLDDPHIFVQANLQNLFDNGQTAPDSDCADLNADDSTPPPASLTWLITRQIPTSIRTTTHTLMLSDGISARQIEIDHPQDDDPQSYITANQATLWANATPIQMQKYFAAVQRNLDPLLNQVINTVYTIFLTNAEPDPADIITAAQALLTGTPKLDEWNKLNTMLQDMSQQQFRQFIALIIVINLSKSARG